MADRVQPVVDVPAMTALLDGKYAEIRDLTRKNLVEHAGVLDDAIEMPRDEFRERVLELVKLMGATGATGLGFPTEYGGGGDIGASVAAFETLGFGDLSILVKVGVQFGLFGGAILQLGSKNHHDAYLADLVKADLLGCFAMTETGHGSNVQALGTVAAYDNDAKEFVITTPDDLSRKDYIGNAAAHASMAVVFAQLEINGASEGVHAFVVPIRDKKGNPLPGVRIEDDGAKIGLNGVDNGRLWFDGVRVPRTDLLNRYADVTEDGRYVSSIENKDRRFFTMLGTLIQGRVCVGGAGITASKVALAVAIKYGNKRRQFGSPETDKEELLLDYGMHQRRLLPLLAKTYALHFTQENLLAELHNVLSTTDAPDRQRRSLESLAAGTKAIGTWHASRTIQECREACGGAGYLMSNRLGSLRADTDVFTTFEGDNHILLQLVAKGLLTDYSSSFGDLDQLGHGEVRGRAGRGDGDRAHQRAQAARADQGRAPRWPRRQLGPGGRTARPGVPARDVPLARGAHPLRRGPAAEARHGPGDGLGRGVQPGAGPRDRGRARARRAADPGGVRRQARSRWSTATTRWRSGMLCDLFALSTIEADRGWFMEHGRLSSTRSKAISREVSSLCRQLRPIAEDLVDGFGIPAEMLRAEMLSHRPDARTAAHPRPRRLGRRPAVGLRLRLVGGAPADGRRAVEGRASAASCGASTRQPRRSAGSQRAPRCSTYPSAAEWPSAVFGPGRGSGTSPRTSRRPCSTAR